MQTIRVGSRLVKCWQKLKEGTKVMQNSNRCITMKTKVYLEFKNTPKSRAVMRARNGSFACPRQAAFWRTQVYRWNSSVWVQKNLNLFQQEHYLKVLLPPLPHLLSEQNDAWIRPKASGRGSGQTVTALQTITSAMHRRGHACNSFDFLILVAPFWQPSLEAQLKGSAEKGAQFWATKPSRWWISLDSGTCDYPEHKWDWVEMLPSCSCWEAGEAGFYSASPERSQPHLSASNHFMGLTLTRLNIEKDATWPSTDINFNRFCISGVRNKYRELAIWLYVLF